MLYRNYLIMRKWDITKHTAIVNSPTRDIGKTSFGTWIHTSEYFTSSVKSNIKYRFKIRF